MPEIPKYILGNISFVLKLSLGGNRTAEKGELLAADAKLCELCRGTPSIREARRA